MGSRGGSGTISARAQVRKEDLVRHAEALFAERGYAETRMTDIAQAAGVTKGLLYWYFASKDELIGEILLDIREQLRATQRASMAGVEGALAQVYVGTVVSVRFVLRHYRLFEVNVPFTQELRHVWGESAVVHASDTSQTLCAGQEEGSIRADHPADVLAHGNAGVVNEFCRAHHLGRIDADAETTARMAAAFIVRGLAADPAAVEDMERRFAAI